MSKTLYILEEKEEIVKDICQVGHLGNKLETECSLKLTSFIVSDVLQKNSAKEMSAGSEVKLEMASGCRKKKD